jgi:O-antigen/teichoic acid export membrane protein
MRRVIGGHASLLRHAVLYLLVRGGSGIISFMALVVYTRVLAPDVYGRYAIVVATAGLVTTVSFQWLSLGLVRYLPSWEDRRVVFLSTIGSVYLVAAVVITAAGAVTYVVWPDTAIRALIPFGVGLAWVQGWYSLTLECLRIELRPARYGMVVLARAALALAVGYTLARLGLGAAGLLAGLVLGAAIPAVLVGRGCWAGIRLPAVDRGALAQLARYGVPLTATFGLTFVVGSSDRILLGWLRDDRLAGLYSVSYDLAQNSVGLVLSIVNLSVFPIVVRALHSEGTAAAVQRLRQNGALLLAAGVPAAVGLVVLAPAVSAVALGAGFRESGRQLIPWIAVAMVLSGVRSFHLDLAFLLGQRTLQQVWVLGWAALTNLVLNLWWIPRYGAMGAAYSTLAAFIVAIPVSWFLGRRTFPVPLLSRDVPRIALASGIMGVVVWLLPRWGGAAGLAAAILVGVGTYAAAVLILNVADARRIALRAVAVLAQPRERHP